MPSVVARSTFTEGLLSLKILILNLYVPGRMIFILKVLLPAQVINGVVVPNFNFPSSEFTLYEASQDLPLSANKILCSPLVSSTEASYI